jgi:hypothetical protein
MNNRGSTGGAVTPTTGGKPPITTKQAEPPAQHRPKLSGESDATYEHMKATSAKRFAENNKRHGRAKAIKQKLSGSHAAPASRMGNDPLDQDEDGM